MSRPRPSGILRAPGSHGAPTDDGFAPALERLQSATDPAVILAIVEAALSASPGVGRGAVYTVVAEGTLEQHALVEGPRSTDLSVPEIELLGVARRALREESTVRQSGVAAATMWACPLRSADGIEAVVAAIGEPDGVATFLAHAGLALRRERRRARDLAAAHDAGDRASELERAISVLDEVVRDGGSGNVLRRVTSAVAGLPGLGNAALWTLRPEDGRYVEAVGLPPDAAPAVTVPEHAHRAEGFVEWTARFPRWGGHPWIPAGTIERVGPGSGDALVLVLAGHGSEPHPLGFVLAEVARPLDDPEVVKDLHRWVALGRHALENRVRIGRNQHDLETLQEEKDRLAELHRMKSQFIAAVSHELRTPLTSITAYAETLRSAGSATEAETRDRFLRVIHDESRRLTRIVDDILELATMDAGRVRMSCRRIDLTAIVYDAIDVIQPHADAKRIALRVRTDDEMIVHADADLLKQLIVNLLENSTKFGPADSTVTVAFEGDATAVRLVVEDEGPGIPADKLDAIFERFYQVDGSNARKHGGSGLGLAICRSIATWHDGRIWAESDLDRGARFVVSLPRARAVSRARAVEPTVAEAPSDEHRIPELMIEMIAEVMRAETVSLMLLEPSGHDLFIQAAVGLPDATIRDARVGLGERIAGTVAASAAPLLVPDVDVDDRFPQESRAGQYRTRSLLSVPVLLRGSVIGVVNVTNKITDGPFTDRDRELLEILAQRVALVLGKLREFGDSREDVRRMEDAIRGVIDVRRHYYPAGDRFSDLVLGICGQLGLDAPTAARIHYASILRDVGMTRLPDGTYKKPSALTEKDRELIRSHPEEGARVLRSIEFLPDVFDIILAHHEEPDGSGYPRGLTGGGIPLGAKILAVADAYDALLAGRPYREAVSVDEAIEELRRHEGTQFDPQVVEALVRAVRTREVRAGSLITQGGRWT